MKGAKIIQQKIWCKVLTLGPRTKAVIPTGQFSQIGFEPLPPQKGKPNRVPYSENYYDGESLPFSFVEENISENEIFLKKLAGL